MKTPSSAPIDDATATISSANGGMGAGPQSDRPLLWMWKGNGRQSGPRLQERVILPPEPPLRSIT